MTRTLTQLLSYGTLILQISVLFSIIYWLYRRKKSDDIIVKFFKNYGVGLAFNISVIAVAGSLYYSEIAQYLPCKLCWLQRIFMYPQVLLLGIAWWKQDHGIGKYSIPLAVIGACFSAYHTYLQQFAPSSTTICSLGDSVNCSVRSVYGFGYISMPLMALTVFFSIIVFVLLGKPSEQN